MDAEGKIRFIKITQILSVEWNLIDIPQQLQRQRIRVYRRLISRHDRMLDEILRVTQFMYERRRIKGKWTPLTD